tara:strand:- start:5522 stop:9064 length:3543 start_codon:yes stop_codon:yes gene_type:complete
MAIRKKYFPGSTVSRYLSPGERSWDEAVYQSGKPVLDAELNLSQEVGREIKRLLQNNEIPSGFLRGPLPLDPLTDYRFPTTAAADFSANGFYMKKRTALVANMPVVVEFTGTTLDKDNLIQLSTATVYGGAPADIKRTDFVFLEVFRAQVQTSPRASGTLTVVPTPTTGTINIGGVNLTPAGGPRGVGTGANNYDNTLGTINAIAADIRDAINDTSNGFAAKVTAAIDISSAAQINLIATDAFAGAAGNAIVFTTTVPADFTLNPLVGNLTGGADTGNKPTQATIYRHGNVGAPAGVNLVDDIADPLIGAESTKRVQVQYRIRTTGQAEGVNFKSENGFSNGNVEAQGTQATTASQYRFVPADGTTVEGYIKVTGVGVIAVGDTITIDGTVLTAVAGAPVGPQFDVSSGVPATIVTSIVAAITGSVASANGTAFGDYAQVVPATAGNNLTITTSLTTATSVNTSVNSAVSYDTVDNGLFISGDGTQQSATDLGTVDGFAYAIPIAFVFRRNDASGTGGFDPVSNTNGALSRTHALFTNTHGIGATPANTSDRPDRNFHDVIVSGDILDLRRQVSPGGIDLKAELESQMTALLDGNFRTWAVDTQGLNTLGSGSGDVSPVRLVCNEIGDQAATGRGETIGTWDHIRRRFGDQSVVERRIFPLLSSSAYGANHGLYSDPAVAGWRSEQVLNIDLNVLDASGLGDWVPTGSPVLVANQWPAGTKITNILRVVHDDGHFATPIDQDVEIDLIQGVGTAHVQITLAPNNRQANGGVSGAAAYALVPNAAGSSNRRIFVELEITYPVGAGASATPDETISADPTVLSYRGAAIENDTTKRPTDWEDLLAPRFRPGYREINIEYVANNVGSGIGSGTPITESVIATGTDLILPRRIYGSASTVITVTEQGTGVPTNRAVDTSATTWGSSERKVVLQGTGVGAGVQSVCNVEFFAQDPIPDFSPPGDSYQISVYFRSNAPQTVGVQAGFPATSPLPASIGLKPMVMSRNLWTGTTSSGSLDLAYPYSNPSDQIPVNADLGSGGSPAFPGEWVLSSLAKISVGDFDAETGLLNLHQMVPVDPNSTLTFSDRAWDGEYRGHYKVADTNAYRPTAMAQPLSGVATHKVWLPFLAQATADNVFFRKGEVLLVVVTRYALLDGDNVVRFTNAGNESCAAVYRTRGLLLLASEQ